MRVCLHLVLVVVNQLFGYRACSQLITREYEPLACAAFSKAEHISLDLLTF